MKTNTILGMALISAAVLTGCGDAAKEKRMQAHIDSLDVELTANREAMTSLQEVGTLLDSIDHNRALLRVNMVEGTTKLSYSSRLKNINEYVTKAEQKIAELEKKSASIKSGFQGTIHRLKEELETANKQLAVLQEEALQLRTEKGNLVAQVTQKDSLITEREQFIKVKEEELVAKEAAAKQMSEQTQVEKANLYYAQATALETAANRTKLAPRKKKETRREAIELYKIALSLGKTEAQDRINELEKEIG